MNKILSFLIIISLFAYVNANADVDEEECDAMCEIFLDIVYFIAGMMWRTCMENEECSSIAVPTVIILFVISIVVFLVMDRNNDEEYEYKMPKARRAFAFGAGYICK
tara:strand:- start:156 stop:476 length:321 start_codon:yes stop_codon:yes gene_type:complete